jgi:N-glycosylase/DNA lyase
MIAAELLDIEACVTSGQVFRFQRTADGWIGVDGNNLIIAVRIGNGWDVCSEPDNEAWKKLFRIGVDMQAIQHQIMDAEPRLAPLIARHPGLRTLQPASIVETLFSFLCTPNNHMGRILGMARYLASFGEELIPGHHAFPELDVLKAIDEDTLRIHGFGYRAKTIAATARELSVRGREWLEALRDTGYETARRELCTLPGVGPKLADCICLFGLHYDDAIPIDTHVWKAITEWYLPEWRGKALTPARYELARELLVARFGLLSGWIQQHLFYDAFLSYRSGKHKKV